MLGTLIVPSFTLKPLVRRLGLGQGEQVRQEEIEVRIRLAHAALSQLEHIAQQRRLPEDMLARLRGVYELRLSRLEASDRETDGGNIDDTEGARMQDVRAELIAAQRRALADMRARRAATAEVMGRIQHDIDLEETRLRARR